MRFVVRFHVRFSFRVSVSCRRFVGGSQRVPPYIYVHFSPKNFLSCQNRSERGGFEWPAGRWAGRTLAAFQPVDGQSPVSGEGVGAAACGGSGAQSPSLVLAGLAFQAAATSCARSKTGNIYIPGYVYSVYV